MGLNQAFYENGSEVDFFTFLKQSIFGVVKGVLDKKAITLLRIEFHSGCIYWIMNAMVKLANP